LENGDLRFKSREDPYKVDENEVEKQLEQDEESAVA